MSYGVFEGSLQEDKSMNVNIYKCFIASPSDTKKEREICEQVFAEINRNLGKVYNFRIESLRWENDVRPGFGIDGQDVINKQIGNDYELFVGIMYKKFGTPTSKAGSGTEEEFNNAYDRHIKNDGIEIMFYFNEAPTNISDIDPFELEKVKLFQTKVSALGGLYCGYNGYDDFEKKLRQHINEFFMEKYIKQKTNTTNTCSLKTILEKRLNDSLCMFDDQPVFWEERILSKTNEISQNPDDNNDNRVDINELIETPKSYIISAPPRFGLTCLAHYFVLTAWGKNNFWIYLDSQNEKSHKIQKSVEKELKIFGKNISDVKCIILDSWNTYYNDSLKKLKTLSDLYKKIPIIVMRTIDDSKFITEKHETITISREFARLHLLAMTRGQMRNVVSKYNTAKNIADEDKLLTKVASDLEVLNIHRTPENCLTLLKVAEKHFDETPVNRTKLLEMVLFVLFDIGEIPTYKTRPDVKDCEYVLGRFCENMIRNDKYEFSKDYFISELRKFCSDKLIDLEIDVVFNILFTNNIIIKKENIFIFRSSFWIFYFAAIRMHGDTDFCDYIFNSKKYLSSPEIIEFYTGIDRNRSDALSILKDDIKQTCDIVFNKVSIPDDINPFNHIRWNPTKEHIEKMQGEISESVLNSGLPDEVKDKYADRNYNQIKPYNQTITLHSIFEKYSLFKLIQEVKATSRALRNSDYADPTLKKELLDEILRSWLQLSKVLFALAPILASKGIGYFEGVSFILSEDFDDYTSDEKFKHILFANLITVVGIFKDDIFSGKIGPLLFDRFKNESNPLIKHQLALLFILGRPRKWEQMIDAYIIALPKDSFFLYDVVNELRTQYRFGFTYETELQEIGFLIKKGLAKYHYGTKDPKYDLIKQIPNSNLPRREKYEDD